jgi:hypothetical protein
MNKGKLRDELEAHEISERAQQEEFAFPMEEIKMMNVCHYNKPDHVRWNDQHSRTDPPAATCNEDCSRIDHP